MSADGAGGDGGPKQRFELYIKASAIDKETKGSCPICQHWFMITCLLGENQEDIDFKVYTVQADCPPKNFGVDQGWSKKFPVVMVLEGRDKRGQDLSGTKYDTFEELEIFFEAINKDSRELKRKNAPNVDAMRCVDNVYNLFNAFLKNGDDRRLKASLKKIDEFLEARYSDCTFLVDNVLCFSDCYLLPRLQHIRVAGKEYMDFEIPAELLAIWRYLANAYQTEAFRSTMPSDQDIVFHYEKKVTNPSALKTRRPRPTLQNFTYTLDIPEQIAAKLQGMSDPVADTGAGANGDIGGGEEQCQAPVEQMSALDFSQQQEQQSEIQVQSQEAAFGADADDYEVPVAAPPPPPPTTAAHEDVVEMEQTTSVQAAPSAAAEDGEAASLEVSEQSAYNESVTADEAVAVNSSPSPSPPPPPAVDYDVCGEETATTTATAAADQENETLEHEPNYVNVDAIRDSGDYGSGSVPGDENEETGGVKITVSQAEDHGDGGGDDVIKNEVGSNGSVVKETVEGVVRAQEEGVDGDDGVKTGAE